jgi:ankyrin repeat protein
VALLLERGADAKARDSHGRGALSLNVTQALDTRTMAGLIKAGADLNSPDDRGRTPLMEAADAANLDAVQLLVWRGADPAAHNNDGATALEIARSARQKPGVAPSPGERLDQIIAFLRKLPAKK